MSKDKVYNKKLIPDELKLEMHEEDAFYRLCEHEKETLYNYISDTMMRYNELIDWVNDLYSECEFLKSELDKVRSSNYGK